MRECFMGEGKCRKVLGSMHHLLTLDIANLRLDPCWLFFYISWEHDPIRTQFGNNCFPCELISWEFVPYEGFPN